MTKLLEEAIQKLAQLPKGRQDELARMLIDVAASDLPNFRTSTHPFSSSTPSFDHRTLVWEPMQLTRI